MRLKAAKVILGISLFTSALSAHAIDSITCDDCTLTKRQMQSKAGGDGDYYFWDFKNRRLYHMNVSGSGGPLYRAAAAPGGTKVKEIMLTADEQAMFNAGMQLYDANGRSETVRVQAPVYDSRAALNSFGGAIAAAPTQAIPLADPPQTYPMNAMDAVTTPAWREAAIAKTLSYDNLGPLRFVGETLRVLVSGFSQAVNITKLPSPFSIVTTIPFPDGSYILVQYTYQDHGYRYIRGSGRDAAGNVIPDGQKDIASPDQASQTYIYPTGPLAAGPGGEMIRHLDNLGVRWIGANSPPVYVGFRIGCSYTPSGAQCQVNSLTP
ncbi:TPA: hypothetical protein UM365_000179 [Stenotrophomonas maltophilia]|nr:MULTISPECIES: hypothetical protein [Stenotrophomonas]MBH1498343.1 hypothetical protein [Stenotrophomonas maltophilia]MBH1534516.1 hypothetical protein [Stenotrophomonas maltophilia]MBH1744503.1 hypothetical protein [Stenotrophomonas maltophilia]MBH1864149.1 hypothetical protein [Stenotrophomonas maltophilia]MBN4945706.1 hypothetical protein [Stenotrophomonas maltophilia]